MLQFGCHILIETDFCYWKRDYCHKNTFVGELLWKNVVWTLNHVTSSTIPDFSTTTQQKGKRDFQMFTNAIHLRCIKYMLLFNTFHFILR